MREQFEAWARTSPMGHVFSFTRIYDHPHGERYLELATELAYRAYAAALAALAAQAEQPVVTDEMIAAAESVEDLYRRGTPETWKKVFLAMWKEMPIQAAQVQRETDKLVKENAYMRQLLETVERWANHHGAKPYISPREALSMIQHHPGIEAITKSYIDGVIPDTPNPYAEIERLKTQLSEIKAQAQQPDYYVSEQHGELKISRKDDSDPAYKWVPVVALGEKQ